MKTMKAKELIIRFLIGFTALLIILIVVLLSRSITMAFLTSSQSKTNKFILAKPDIKIEELNVSDQDSMDWGIDSMNVRISADSEHTSVYVKVALIISAKDQIGNVLPLDLGPLTAPDTVTGELVAGDFTLHFNPDWDNNWFFKDGYFYYKHILHSGEETEILLEGITLTNDSDSSIKEKYRNMRLYVDVFADSIQATSSAVEKWGVSLQPDGVTLSVFCK